MSPQNKRRVVKYVKFVWKCVLQLLKLILKSSNMEMKTEFLKIRMQYYMILSIRKMLTVIIPTVDEGVQKLENNFLMGI